MENQHRNRNCFTQCGDIIKGIDQFGEGFRMKLDNGEQKYGSFFGVFVTVLFGLVLFGFSYAKMETLIGRDDIDIISSYEENHFADNE